MKVIARILLIITAIPIFVLLVISVNIKFQFLNSNFWIQSFNRGNVYKQLSEDLKGRLQERTVEEGGNASDVEDLSSLISENNIKIFFEENIKSVILYANGKSPEIIVTFPFSNNLWNLSQTMKLSDFLKENNIEIINPSDIQKISNIGHISTAVFILLAIFSIAVCILLFVLTNKGSHFTCLGLPFLFSGIIFIFLYAAGIFSGNILLNEFVGNSNVGKSMTAIIAMPIIDKLSTVWLWTGFLFIVSGIVLFFIKKPANNQR